MRHTDFQLRVVAAYLTVKDSALKHWMGALELAQALSGKPDLGQSYQALQEQKQRIKLEQIQTKKNPSQLKNPPPKSQKSQESEEYDVEEDEDKKLL